MIDFIMYLFDTTGFIPKVHAGESWTYQLIVATLIAHSLMALFFIAVTFILIRIWNKRHNDIPRRDIFKAFLVFCISLAASRTCIALAFYWPVYRFYLVVHYICAIATIVLAYKLCKGYREILVIPSADAMRVLTESLRNEVRIREKTQQELLLQNQALITVVEHLKYIVETEMWLHDKNSTIKELNNVLRALGDDDS
jgi:hypothetical protein